MSVSLANPAAWTMGLNSSDQPELVITLRSQDHAQAWAELLFDLGDKGAHDTTGEA